MTDELKPCPFCGHEPKHLGLNAPFAVACVNDACVCLANSDYVGAWNTRPVEDALRVRIVELEAQWASVPWGELDDAFGNFFGEAWADEGSPVDTIDKWLTAYSPTSAPKEGDNG